LVLEGKREPDALIDFLQKFVFGTDLGVELWGEVYKLLGMKAEYAEFAKSQSVCDNPSLWAVPVIQGVSCNKVVAGLRKLDVNVYTYADDLDAEVVTNDRDPANGSYFIGFAKNVEADEENKSLSVDTLKSRGHKGITLLERLLLELAYFMATGKHLDVDNWTLCTGSRDRDGDVPSVRWSSDYREVYVYWCGSDDSGDGLRSRSAVSLSA
jgi:hypothetical protein